MPVRGSLCCRSSPGGMQLRSISSYIASSFCQFRYYLGRSVLPEEFTARLRESLERSLLRWQLNCTEALVSISTQRTVYFHSPFCTFFYYLQRCWPATSIGRQ